jgi:hypothetical protein
MLRGKHHGGGWWFVVRVGETRFRVDWKQQINLSRRSGIKIWTAYKTEPIKFHVDKNWTHFGKH